MIAHIVCLASVLVTSEHRNFRLMATPPLPVCPQKYAIDEGKALVDSAVHSMNVGYDNLTPSKEVEFFATSFVVLTIPLSALVFRVFHPPHSIQLFPPRQTHLPLLYLNVHRSISFLIGAEH